MNEKIHFHLTALLGAAFALLLAGPLRPALAQDGLIGATACLACHETQKEFEHNMHVKGLLNGKGITFEKSCETCHGPGEKHAGAAGDKKNPDFFSILNPKTMKPEQASQTCLTCHSGGRQMHWKGSVHEAKNLSCTSCHSMHDPKANKGRAPLLNKATKAETCYQCHGEKKGQIRKSMHMPLVEGKMGCSSCHNPHGSPADKMMAKASVPETCYTCHQDKRGPHMWEHPPVRENCSHCHDPHGSHHESMLKTRQPLLCQRCHVANRHPSGVYDLTEFNNNSRRVANKGCYNCHSTIHGSNHPGGRRFMR